MQANATGLKTRERQRMVTAHPWKRSPVWFLSPQQENRDKNVLGQKTSRSKISQFYFSILGEKDVLHLNHTQKNLGYIFFTQTKGKMRLTLRGCCLQQLRIEQLLAESAGIQVPSWQVHMLLAWEYRRTAVTFYQQPRRTGNLCQGRQPGRLRHQLLSIWEHVDIVNMGLRELGTLAYSPTSTAITPLQAVTYSAYIGSKGAKPQLATVGNNVQCIWYC